MEWRDDINSLTPDGAEDRRPFRTVGSGKGPFRKSWQPSVSPPCRIRVLEATRAGKRKMAAAFTKATATGSSDLFTGLSDIDANDAG